jgi:two-component system, NarL family, invasion response regulator UvrY
VIVMDTPLFPNRRHRRARIMIADDHPVVRRGLRDIVEMEADLQVVAEAETASEVLARAARSACDVIVLDLSMPGASGLSVLKELRRRHPQTAVLVLSVAPEEQFALRAVKAGAAGYLTKRSAPDQLVDAIRCVIEGRVHLSVAAGRSLVSEVLRPEPRRGAQWQRLSDRELEILRLLASGMSPTRIGGELGISVKTVSTHRARILTKLGMSSTASLVRYAIAERLIDD